MVSMLGFERSIVMSEVVVRGLVLVRIDVVRGCDGSPFTGGSFGDEFGGEPWEINTRGARSCTRSLPLSGLR